MEYRTVAPKRRAFCTAVSAEANEGGYQLCEQMNRNKRDAWAQPDSRPFYERNARTATVCLDSHVRSQDQRGPKQSSSRGPRVSNERVLLRCKLACFERNDPIISVHLTKEPLKQRYGLGTALICLRLFSYARR